MSTSITPRGSTHSCLVSLVEINLRWLRQGLALLGEIDENVYSTTPPCFPQYSVGAHVRHVLDFYQCFFKGLKGRQIDYDVRSRDRNIEISRSAASIAIRNSIHAFEHCPSLRVDSSVLVRPEGADDCALENSFMRSSVSRELQALSSHIALTLRLHGMTVDPEFGMAPSTLRFLASKSKVFEAAA